MRISSLQSGIDLNRTQKSAWFMLQRIRQCFGINDDSELTGEVEIDETYVGGKAKNSHNKIGADKLEATTENTRNQPV